MVKHGVLLTDILWVKRIAGTCKRGADRPNLHMYIEDIVDHCPAPLLDNAGKNSQGPGRSYKSVRTLGQHWCKLVAVECRT